MLGIAAAAFVVIFVFDVPFPIIILAAGLIGFVGGRLGRPEFLVGGGHGASGGRVLADADSLLGEGTPVHARPTLGWSLKVSAVCLALWLGPVAALLLGLGPADVYSEIAVFFSKMAVVTFGGAYAVLAYVAQQAVEHYGWLQPGEMLDGLGMTETTPGPLIMVIQRRQARRVLPRAAAGRHRESPGADAVRLIDVLWLDRDKAHVTAAFEVEHSTSIYSGIVRMLDLALGTEAHALEGMFLVAPNGREDEVRAQLARPAFSRVADLKVRYLPYGELETHRESIVRFGTGMKAIHAISRSMI